MSNGRRKIDAARELIDEVPSDKIDDPDIRSVRAGLELAGDGAEAAHQSEIRKEILADPENYQARYDLALALFAKGNKEDAVDNYYLSLRRIEWNDDAAQTACKILMH